MEIYQHIQRDVNWFVLHGTWFICEIALLSCAVAMRQFACMCNVTLKVEILKSIRLSRKCLQAIRVAYTIQRQTDRQVDRQADVVHGILQTFRCNYIFWVWVVHSIPLETLFKRTHIAAITPLMTYGACKWYAIKPARLSFIINLDWWTCNCSAHSMLHSITCNSPVTCNQIHATPSKGSAKNNAS